MVKNPPYNAGDMGSIPGQGTKIPHATGQLSPRAELVYLRACILQTTELVYLRACNAANYRAHAPWSLCATTRERKPARHD